MVIIVEVLCSNVTELLIRIITCDSGSYFSQFWSSSMGNGDAVFIKVMAEIWEQCQITIKKPEQ